jgi:calcineurin-like phosphoesterase family protein
MFKVWFTADLHLGHGNIIKYCLRPFLAPDEQERARTDPRGKWRLSEETVRRHDEALLEAVNCRVDAGDTLWILGDFCWGKLPEARSYRDRIACRNVHLVWGNHDHRSIRPLFGQALEQGMIRVEDQDLWLNHYPMRSWDRSFHGSWHLYGHVHGRLAAEDAAHDWTLTRDVGVDACAYRPWSFEEIREYMRPRLVRFQQHRDAILAGASEQNPGTTAIGETP